ncbi:MAG: aldehyde dehydrogenase family protein [Flavobacteriia bacterium]|jgi:acyl-CoA reductase-like NAD-dependent aldehyde dehydrogenase|nr:aldehyde dehydrogenase family protein [Flavobacteriia bacterium]
MNILKTYKIYIGGAFPRTESGRYYPITDSKGNTLANVCLSSRKDVRNAVVAARKAFGGWSEKTAFNRGQILYRIAEMLDGRKAQFIDELVQQGISKSKAEKEVQQSVDRLVYYAGWADKYQQIASSVNPVSSSHFNFSALEPMGVIGVIAPQQNSLLGLISSVIPAICGGNTVVVAASESHPLCAVTFAEVLHSSDVPGGVVNILTGKIAELAPALAAHMDINALLSSGLGELQRTLALSCVENLKRNFSYSNSDQQGLNFITDLQEVKTTWHPIESIGGATSSY